MANISRVLTDPDDLLQIGVCKVDLTAAATTNLSSIFTPEELKEWADELSQVTPLNTFAEDGEYAFYRNIIDHEFFPFDKIIDAIAPTIEAYFDVNNTKEDLRLDDAFCIMYDASLHDDTTGKKHMDPSDITVNICFEKSKDVIGSEVLFYGRQNLYSSDTKNELNIDLSENAVEEEYLVSQEAGWATIHFGYHWHQTMEMIKGRRTNIVMTFCHNDPARSDATTRTCYATK